MRIAGVEIRRTARPDVSARVAETFSQEPGPLAGFAREYAITSGRPLSPTAGMIGSLNRDAELQAYMGGPERQP